MSERPVILTDSRVRFHGIPEARVRKRALDAKLVLNFDFQSDW